MIDLHKSQRSKESIHYTFSTYHSVLWTLCCPLSCLCSNAIQCYYCFGVFPNPFNRTDAKVSVFDSPSGWCMKFKASRDQASILIHSPDTFGVCSENKYKTTLHEHFQGAGCCCNTELCNNSNTIANSLNSIIGLILLAGMNRILNC